MAKIYKYKFLILIIALSAFLRIFMLGDLPALNADEAAIGYNAYSLIETGLDEHGNSWPIHFQSFNDYKPGLFFYVVLPFVKLLGLSIWAVRIPGALIGVLNIFAIWILVREIWPDKKYKPFALLSALLLAVSPWHIHFSRGAWEVNAATLLMTLGVIFFLKGLKDSKYFSISVISFVASLYTYHSARVIVPLLGIALIVVYSKKLFKLKNKKNFFGSGLLGFVLLVPLLVSILGPAVGARASGVSIFSDRGPVDRINIKRGEHDDLNSLSAKIVHNKPVEYALNFSENYLEHFWGEFLFLSGDDIQRNKVPEFGLLYLFQFPLIIFALYLISRNNKNWAVILSWLAISPIAASLTFQSPHALRAQNMVIPLTIISAYGLFILLNYKNKLLNLFIILVIFWSLSRYVHQYYIHMAKTYPFSSQYGVEEMAEYVNERYDDFDEIYITDRYDQPYILYLFYSKYSPEKFQNSHQLSQQDQFGFSTVRDIEKIHFESISWDFIRDKRKILVVGTEKEIVKEEANVIKIIYFPNGDVAFYIAEL